MLQSTPRNNWPQQIQSCLTTKDTFSSRWRKRYPWTPSFSFPARGVLWGQFWQKSWEMVGYRLTKRWAQMILKSDANLIKCLILMLLNFLSLSSSYTILLGQYINCLISMLMHFGPCLSWIMNSINFYAEWWSIYTMALNYIVWNMFRFKRFITALFNYYQQQTTLYVDRYCL